MTSHATHPLHRFAARLQRDWLLAILGAITLSVSWYCAAALDHYRIPAHALQRTEQSAFDQAFLTANRIDEMPASCEQGECVRVAQASSHAGL